MAQKLYSCVFNMYSCQYLKEKAITSFFSFLFFLCTGRGILFGSKDPQYMIFFNQGTSLPSAGQHKALSSLF